jgi:hypothetical protein
MAEKKKKKVSSKSLKNLEKGRELMKKAVALAKEDGKVTVPAHSAYKKPMSYYLQKAAK